LGRDIATGARRLLKRAPTGGNGMFKVAGLTMMFVALSAFAAGCGGQQDVSSDGPGDTTTPTPTPGPTPAPTPSSFTIHFVGLHVYDDGDTFGNGESYWTFALNDTIRYSTQISISNNTDYNPEDHGVTGADFTANDGDPIYIYADGYDH